MNHTSHIYSHSLVVQFLTPDLSLPFSRDWHQVNMAGSAFALGLWSLLPRLPSALLVFPGSELGGFLFCSSLGVPEAYNVFLHQVRLWIPALEELWE